MDHYRTVSRKIYNVKINKMCLPNINIWNAPVSAAAMLPRIVEVRWPSNTPTWPLPSSCTLWLTNKFHLCHLHQKQDLWLEAKPRRNLLNSLTKWLGGSWRHQRTAEDIRDNRWHQISIKILEFLDIEILRYWNIGIFEYWDIEILRYRNFEIFEYLKIWILR